MHQGVDQSKRELFETNRLGRMTMKNRFVIPGMSRFRAYPTSCTPSPLMGQFYSQRYHNALIITEPTLISNEYIPVSGMPGLFSDQHVSAWNEIVDKVHAKASNFIVQLFHPGRVVSDEQLKVSGKYAKAASAIQIKGSNRFAQQQPFSTPKSMTVEEITALVEDFKKAGLRAREAGFDGVQIEAGNGYLIDTFLRDSANTRTDQYGGSIPNRCRLLLEIVDVLSQIHGSQWVSVKISPTCAQYDMNDSNPNELMSYLLPELSKRQLAFVEIRKGGLLEEIPSNPTVLESPTMDMSKRVLEDSSPGLFEFVRELYSGSLVANYDFATVDEANELVKNHKYSGIAFDILSIGNPDLPQRVKERGRVNYTVRTVFIFRGQRDGYVDYPFYIAHSKL